MLYVLFRSEHFLFARLGGLTGLLGGLSVALRQYACSHGTLLALPVSTPNPSATSIASSPAGPLLHAALPHAPSLCLLWAALVLLTTHSGPPDELLFAFNGILVAWVYLRYYQPREASTAGDPSADFTFAAGLAGFTPPAALADKLAAAKLAAPGLGRGVDRTHLQQSSY